MKKTLLFAALLAALAGCNSLRVSQVNHFSDDDGNVVKVEFSRAKNDHAVRFIGPKGDELESQTKLAVEVELPNGKTFTAWKTLNPTQLTSGTVYKTDNEKYMFWAHGFNCMVFIFDKEKNDYAIIFEGTLIKN